MARNLFVLTFVTLLLAPGVGRAQTVPTPEQFFGFTTGQPTASSRAIRRSSNTLQLLAKSDRSRQVRGASARRRWATSMRCCGSARRRTWRGSIGWSRSTGGSPIRAACPTREAQKLAAEGKPFYLLYATIHSTEVSNGQAIIHIVHRLATENSPSVREILDNAVVLLVPSQNPDGQHLVIDHWYKTKGTTFNARLPGPVPQVRRPRRQPRLVHVHAEGNAHEHRAGAEQVQADHHARHAPAGRRRLAHLRAAFHRSVRREHPPDLALGRRQSARRWRRRCGGRQGRRGLDQGYDMWSPARQYMVYHGQPRILTEIASGEPRRSVRQPAEGSAARPAGVALELSGPVLEGHMDAGPAGGLRRHRGARRHRPTSPSTAASGSTTSTGCTATG